MAGKRFALIRCDLAAAQTFRKAGSVINAELTPSERRTGFSSVCERTA